MTDEKRDLGRVVYEAYCEQLGDTRHASWDYYTDIFKLGWRKVAESVAAIAREEGYREGLETAVEWLDAHGCEYDADSIRALKDETR